MDTLFHDLALPPNLGPPILSNMHATAAHDRLCVKAGGLPGVSRMLSSIEVEPIRATSAIPAIRPIAKFAILQVLQAVCTGQDRFLPTYEAMDLRSGDERRAGDG